MVGVGAPTWGERWQLHRDTPRRALHVGWVAWGFGRGFGELLGELLGGASGGGGRARLAASRRGCRPQLDDRGCGRRGGRVGCAG